MKRELIINVDPSYTDEQKKIELVSKLGNKVLKAHNVMLSNFFNLNGWKEEDISLLKNILKEQGYTVSVFSDLNVFERKDLENCDYVVCVGQRNDTSKIDVITYNANGTDPEYDNTNYNARCMRGAVQILPLRCVWKISGSLWYKLFTSTWSKHWFIGDDLKMLLEKEKISGLKYMPVHRKNGEIIDGVWQIMPDNELPSGLFSDKLYSTDKNQPDSCARNPIVKGFRQENLILKQEAKKHLKDFTETFERPFIYDRGMYIMSIKIARIFWDVGISPGKYDFYPVQFE